MTIREQLAKNLAYYRKKAGFTQKEAAKRLGTKLTTISSGHIHLVHTKKGPAFTPGPLICASHVHTVSGLPVIRYSLNHP